jgi:hypothetical protein
MSLETALQSRFPAAPSSDLHGAHMSFQGHFARSCRSAVGCSMVEFLYILGRIIFTTSELNSTHSH